MGKYDLNALLGDLEKTENKGEKKEFSSDFWKPTLDKKEERAEYIIRFLPNPDSETSAPWVERAAHMFEFTSSGKFTYEPCPQKAKKGKCYYCEQVNELYNSGDPAKEKQGGKRFAKKRFYHNILVVSDPRDGGKNEGKVMIFEAGSQIHDKCIEFLKNTELDPSERIYFHPTAGTNFKLVMTWKSDFPNYEKSDFLRRPSGIEVDGAELSMDEAEEFIEDKAYGLNAKLLDDKFFKSYDKLKDLWENQGVVTETKKDTEEEVDEDTETVEVKVRNPETKVQAEKTAPKKSTKIEEDDDTPPWEGGDDSDEDEELAKLLEG